MRQPRSGTTEGHVTPRAAATRPGAAGRPLGREFSKLWAAAATSAIGDGVSLTAAPLMASTLTGDPRLIAGVTTALTLPFALFGLPAGVLVDRLDRRRSMTRVDAFRGCVVTAFALSVAFGGGHLLSLYACFFLVGTCETFYRNASQAIVPAVVPRARLVEANGRLVSMQMAANQFVGPLLGSAIFVLTRSLPFAVDAATFFVSAVLLSRLRVREPVAATDSEHAPARPGLLIDMTTGARWLVRHRLLRSLSLSAAMINLVTVGGMAVLVVHAHRVLGLGAFGYGLLMACQAVGAVTASKAAPALARRIGGDHTLVVVAVALVTANAVIWLAPVATVVGAALALGACAGVTWDVVVVALRQTLVPERLQGRVNSVYRLVAWGAMPVGAGLGGVVSHTFGTPTVFGTAAVIMALVAVRLTAGARRGWIDATRDPGDTRTSAEPRP